MKRWAGLLLLAAVAAPGCYTVPVIEDKGPPPHKAEEVKEAPAAPQVPPVMPEQVTESNATEIERRLGDELNRDRNSSPSVSGQSRDR